jgi:hypothetical protein
MANGEAVAARKSSFLEPQIGKQYLETLCRVEVDLNVARRGGGFGLLD